MFFKTPKTVASVVASFQQTIDDLETISANEVNKANELAVEIAQLNAARQNAVEEANSADKIADKIRKLISA